MSLPKVFKNTNITNDNNRDSFYSFKDSITDSMRYNEDRVVKDKPENLFNVPVEIITRNGKYEGRIVSKLKDHILTSNNDKILLSDIIEIKNRL